MNPIDALPPGIVFAQPLTPVANSLLLSFLVAAIPIAVALIALGVLRRPAWQASLAGLVAGLAVAIGAWGMPAGLAFNAVGAGMALAVVPVMWIVFNALLLYNIAVKSGRFDQFRQWMLDNLPDDRRLVLLVVAFSFGCLLEGISGFGTPVAITSALLIALGFPALEALTYTLLFNTAPVAFGALGVPITVLGAVTSLPPATLAQMVGRQLPFFALLLPFYVVGAYGGLRSISKLWPALLVSGGSFAIAQFVTSNFLGYQLTDVLSSLTSLIVTIGFLQVWKPQPDPQYALARSVPATAGAARAGFGGWLPWLVVSVVVIVWVHANIAAIGDVKIKWPGLHNAVFVSLYHKPYAAIWDFQPLGTGTAILVSAIITAALTRTGVGDFFECVVKTWRQTWIAIVTVMMIVGLAYLLNYSGISYTLGTGVASTGGIVPAGVRVARLDRGVPVRQRHVGQRVVRQPAGRGRAAARPRSGADGRDQLVGRRDGQDDLAAEHRDGCIDDGPERAGRCRVCAHLLAQRDSHAAARRVGVPPAARADVDDSGTAEMM